MRKSTHRIAALIAATAVAGGSFALASVSSQASAHQNEDPIVIMADQEYPPVIGR